MSQRLHNARSLFHLLQDPRASGGDPTSETAGEFDRVAWKRFWLARQKYETICLKCASRGPNGPDLAQGVRAGYAPNEHSSSDSEASPHRSRDKDRKNDWGPVFLNAAAKAILMQVRTHTVQ